jgi:serine/threonine-protein kinase
MTAPFVAPDTVPVLGGGRYSLGDVLGRGGMAVTRRAEDRKLCRPVAIKSLVPDPDPDAAAAARARFLREARSLARFDHPGIVRVYEAFEEAGTAHLVMELLHGRSLGVELTTRARPLDVAEAVTVAAGAGRALGLVHAAGMLHRDVSPSNIVLVGGRPVLVDFGLARDVLDGRTSEVFTRMVTPGFAPPEQYDGDADRVGPPTDVYGLAATLYHALAGRLPASAVQRAAGVRLEPLRRLRPDAPRVLADGIHDGLELEPAHRPPTMADFLARLGLPAPVTIAPVPARTPAPPPPPAFSHLISSPERPNQVREPEPVAAKRRWPAVVPVLGGVAAVGWVLPLPALVALALLAVPAVATAGERLHGTRSTALPGRFAHHVAATGQTLAAPGIVALGGVLLAVLLDRLAPASAADAVVAGMAGALAAVAIARPATIGPLAERWVERCRGRTLTGAWLLAVLLLAGALTFEPDLLPFQG